MLSKEELRKKFSKEWEKYYKINFLIDEGFVRKKCEKCGKFFWTLNPDRNVCSDSDCIGYQFIGKKLTKKKLNYVETWKEIEKFFVKNGHVSIKRYPVVCRWYPLPFVIASIVNFYRIENGRIAFEFPENPLIVPQFSLRFKDVENVGLTGRHYTSFIMIGQHSLYDGKKGYWKERTIELDYKLLTKVFGVPKKEIVFIEDVWLGPQAFGPSLEYFVQGLELGNAVFTEFEIINGKIREMKNKVVDMGAGLERFAWLSSQVPVSYEIVFEPVLKYLKSFFDFKIDESLLIKYYKIAGKYNAEEIPIEKINEIVKKELKIDESQLSSINLLKEVYAIADHTRTLIIAISDGAIPSNVGGGYNLRVIYRRVLDILEKLEKEVDLMKVVELFSKQLKNFDVNIEENFDFIQKIFEIEKERYEKTKSNAKKIVLRILRKKGEIDESDLKMLYESHGITPEIVKSIAPQTKIPEDFYQKISEKKRKVEKVETKFKYEISNLKETEKLFYQNVFEIESKVLKVFDERFVVLDKTIFYPRMGGQDCDKGFINGCKVVDVFKIGNVIIHEVENCKIKEGEIVKCVVDKERRKILTQLHDATHILLAACRKVLGNHVWQAGAEKSINGGRLDITHYQKLSEEEIEKIEKIANEIVRKNLPIKKFVLPRVEAEKKYGFRIYQGGYVPERKIRIVEIEGVDVEACSGTHFDSTSETICILIKRSKRIHDGVVRLEFLAGEQAIKFLEEKIKILEEVEKILNANDENVIEKVEELFKKWKKARKSS